MSDPFQIRCASSRTTPPWVQTMVEHIGDLEELKRQLKALNERLSDIRDREKHSTPPPKELGRDSIAGARE